MTEEQAYEPAGQLAIKLAKTAGQIMDGALRKHYVIDRLVALPDELTVEVLHGLQINAAQGDADSTAVISTALDAALLAERLGKLRVGRIYHEAAHKQYDEVCNLFRSLRPVKEPDGDENAFMQYGLHDRTLGERKSAARSLNPDILDRVSYDPDPDVIRQLLQNPRITEQHVVRIAARRPNYPEILAEIFQSPKWKSRPQVRIALIRNPYTPPQIAMLLIPTLMLQDLREVVADASIHQEVRSAAQRALTQKRHS